MLLLTFTISLSIAALVLAVNEKNETSSDSKALLSDTTLDVQYWNESTDGPFSEFTLAKKFQSLGYKKSVLFSFAPGWTREPHTHDDDRIGGPATGTMKFTMNLTSVDLIPGMYLKVPKHAVHALEVIGNVNCRFVEASE